MNCSSVKQPRSSPRRGAVLACLAALGLSGCQSISANGYGAAQVRFVNASPDAPAMDLYLNGNGTAYNLGFGTVTSYIPVAAGESRIAANRANTGQVLVSARASLGGTRQYTAVLNGPEDALQTTLYPDASAPAPPGMMAVRVLNEASTAGPLDVYFAPSYASFSSGATAMREIAPAGSSGYENLPVEKRYLVAVVPAGSPGAVPAGAILSGVSLSGSSGAVRTLVISDGGNGRASGLNGLVLEDSDTP